VSLHHPIVNGVDLKFTFGSQVSSAIVVNLAVVVNGLCNPKRKPVPHEETALVPEYFRVSVGLSQIGAFRLFDYFPVKVDGNHCGNGNHPQGASPPSMKDSLA
jgi:hypothetical protein